MLLPFGGAGGLHAVELARALRIPRVIAPTSGGALSALGALASDVVKDWSRTVMLEASAENRARIEQTFREMEVEARAALRREGFVQAKQHHQRSLSVRYIGQSFELIVKWTDDIEKAFHRAHRARYGYAQKGNKVEVVSARLRSSGVVEQLREIRPRSSRPRGTIAPQSFSVAYFKEGKQRVGIYARENLSPGARLRTPCIVTEYSATTLVPAGSRAGVDDRGNLIIEP